MTLNAAGQVVGQRRYEAYGQGRWSSGEEQTDFGFNSHREESEFGLYDYQARYFSPLLGRFISADPIVPDFSNPQSLNRYAYVYNNPLKYIDPSGHDPWWLQDPWRRTTDQYDEIGASFGDAYHAAEQARVGSYYGSAPPLQAIAHSQPAPPSQERLRESTEMAIATVCDVCDVVLTLNRWRQGDFSGWDVAGMAAPIISAKAARKLGEVVGGRARVPRLNRNALTPEENNALNTTLEHIRSGTRPDGVHHWGGRRDVYENKEGYLPRDVQYKIYDVAPHPKDTTMYGTRRVVIGNNGQWYYSNTHYGDRKGNPFYRLK